MEEAEDDLHYEVDYVCEFCGNPVRVRKREKT